MEHTFDCSEKAFWDTFLDDAYNKAMFVDSMKFPRWEVTRFDLSDSELVRTVEVEPYVGQLPGPIVKVLGNRIRYREEGRLDRAKGSYKLSVVPGKFADKIVVTAEQRTEALGPDRCKRIFTAEVSVKIFAIGGMIEKQVVADLRKSYDEGARFTQQYMKERGIK
jgi:Protein of unknown function (DUF2505)